MANLPSYRYQSMDAPHAATARHPDEIAPVLAQAEAICRAQGARLTAIRRDVLKVLYLSPKPLGAYDLADLLSPGKRTAPITVYRALDFLIEQGLAHRLASQNAYIATIEGTGEAATAFLICEECGGVEQASSPAFATALSDLVQRAGFQARANVLEVTGRCTRCQGRH